MKRINEIVKAKQAQKDNTVNNGNENIANIVINDTKRKYSLDRSKFTPNTEEAQLAENIAIYFDDLENFAFYFSVVKRRGVSSTMAFFSSVKQEIAQKKNTKYPIRSPKKYFAWKYKHRLY